MQPTVDQEIARVWRCIRFASERGDMPMRAAGLLEMDALLDAKLDALALTGSK